MSQRTTSWERKCDGTKWSSSDGAMARERAKCIMVRVSVRDVESISREIRRTSMTTVDEQGVIRGEVAGAIIEDRRWSEV